MPEIPTPDAIAPIVNESGEMSDNFQRWARLITDLDLLVGTGSPEGVIEATVGRAYMDETGTTGALLYLKRDADIGGDKTRGWVAV